MYIGFHVAAFLSKRKKVFKLYVSSYIDYYKGKVYQTHKVKVASYH